MSNPNPPNPKPTRLSADKKRALKSRLMHLISQGEAVTAAKTRMAATEALGLDIDQEFAENTLEDFGFQMSEEVEPYLGPNGALETSRIWVMAPGAKPLTPSDKAIALQSRMRALTEAFVEDVLEDPQLGFADLEDKAIESTRLFALALSAGVQARARFGAKKILTECGEVASMTFRGALQDSQR